MTTSYITIGAILMLLGLIGGHARARAKAKHEADVKEAFKDTHHMVWVMMAVLTVLAAVDMFVRWRQG